MKEAGVFCDDDVARPLNVFTSRARRVLVSLPANVLDLQTEDNVHERQCSPSTNRSHRRGNQQHTISP
jgi:hypothetical protein